MLCSRMSRISVIRYRAASVACMYQCGSATFSGESPFSQATTALTENRVPEYPALFFFFGMWKLKRKGHEVSAKLNVHIARPSTDMHVANGILR